jgi:hypothetical protein
LLFSLRRARSDLEKIADQIPFVARAFQAAIIEPTGAFTVYKRADYPTDFVRCDPFLSKP